MFISKVVRILCKASVILPLLVMVSCVGGVPYWCYSLIFIAYLLYTVITVRKTTSINGLELMFLLSLVLCTLLSSPDSVFHSWERLLLFAILVVFSTSLLQSDYNRNLRRKSLLTVIYVSILISVVSFFCYYLNINLFENSASGDYFADYNDFIGHFSGVARHSMILGPLAGMSVIYLVARSLNEKKVQYIVLLLLCVGALLFAASRGAILATLFGVFVYCLKSKYKGKRKSAILAVVAMVLLFPIYQPYINAVLNKHEHHGDMGIYDTRTIKFEARIDEFSKSPVYGVGFCAIDPNGKDAYNRLTGSIEPGSSWLAVLSMCGMIGFIFVLSIMFKAFYQANRRKDYILVALLVFFFIHMLVEGYIFSAGNAFSFTFWLTVGCCLDLKYNRNNISVSIL